MVERPDTSKAEARQAQGGPEPTASAQPSAGDGEGSAGVAAPVESAVASAPVPPKSPSPPVIPFTPRPAAKVAVWSKGMFYGDPGVGKTFLCGTATKFDAMKPVLLLDAEAGTMSIRDTGVDVVEVRSYEEVGRIVKWLRENDYKRVSTEGKVSDTERYRTLVVDSLSELQRHVMRGILTLAVNRDPEHDPDIPEQRDWLKNAERVRKLVRGVRDLQIHVIFTCLARERQDERTGSVMVKPHLPGQLADEVAGFLDYVGYQGVTQIEVPPDQEGQQPTKKLVRRVFFQPTGRFIAKDRSGRLPAFIDDPTAEKIVGPIIKT